jgi:uncharacterized protein YdeI (YjbR/CyaY-like superfamily)
MSNPFLNLLSQSSPMAQFDSRIDAYIAKAEDFAQPILSHLRQLVHTACPDVEEGVKWGMPHFMYQGAILCSMASFKQHAVFGFWKASLMPDPDGILTIPRGEGMGHMGKIQTLKDLPKDAILTKYIKEAMKLNDEGIKRPSPAKPTEAQKKELAVPADLVKELKKNKPAEKVFKDASYSFRKEYIMWVEEAKTEATRNKRIAQAVEWIAEGKGRNWKYENC